MLASVIIEYSVKSLNKVFDYMGCIYPEGVFASDKNMLFDHEQIDKLLFLGYSNLQEKQFKMKLNEFVSKGGNVNFKIEK
jgi:hypothetical protein